MDNSTGKTAESENAVKNWSRFLLKAILCFAVSGTLSCESIDKTAWKGPTAAEAEKDLPASTPHGNEVEEIYIEGGNTGILMLHGFSASPLSFKPMASAFNQRGYTVYCPRLAGHGRTAGELGKVEKEAYYKSVDRKLVEFYKKVDKVFILGHSLGSLLTTYLAANHDLDGIILMSAPFLPVKAGLDLDTLHSAAAVIGKVADKLPRANPRYLIHTDYLEKHGLYSEFSIKGLEIVIELIVDARDNISKVDEPILVIQATHDPLADTRGAEFIVNKAKSRIKKVIYVDSVSHRFYIGDKMPLIVEAVCEFIDTVEKKKQNTTGND